MFDSLHEQLELLIPRSSVKRSHIRSIIHAMIDLGLVTNLECQWDGCKQQSRSFSPYPRELVPGESFNRDRLRVAIDHIVPVFHGGSDRPQNLQVVHQVCNQSKSISRRPRSEETKRRISEGQRRSWRENGDERRQQVADINQDETVKSKRSESLKRHYADPKNREKLSETLKMVRNTPEAREKAREAANKRWQREREEAEGAHRM